MIVSVNFLKKFTDIDLPINELVELIGSRLVEIEDVIDLGKKYEGIVVVKVVECKPLEGSDHLSVTKIDDGGAVENVERDENGFVQVVCGAPNVREGLSAVWLAPGVTLPATYDDPKPVVLEARPLRGVVSNGMLASPQELGIGESHEGILEINEEVVPGSSFAELYELDDILLDIENKSLTHRPDTFGIIGFAREVAGIQGKQFTTPPQMLTQDISWIDKEGDEPVPQVTIEDPSVCSRYQAVVVTDADATAQSPLSTQSHLARMGVRPHSAVVDATNYLMMVTGQPLHAFDYDKLKSVNGGRIDMRVRTGRESEKLLLLDGREIELTPNDIVIANGETAVALAGAMGGRDTEIDDSTKNILLESATFNLYNLRNTQMRHGIFSEAITRFTKGQPAELTAPVLAEAVKLLQISAGAKRASDVADAYPDPKTNEPVNLPLKLLNETLGSDFGMEQAVTTLTNVGFAVDVEEPYTIIVTAPYWRTDIHIAEDVIEEIGRLNGFDTITLRLPKRDFTAVSPTNFDEFRARVRSVLARAGANEVLTYSFVHGNLLEKAGQSLANAYRIVNSISPDLQYYRLTLTPSLLSLIHPNSKAGFDGFAVFELNKTHSKANGEESDGLPTEIDRLALSYAGSKNGGTAYYPVKRILDYLGSQLQVEFEYVPFAGPVAGDVSAPFDPRRSAHVTVKGSGEQIGIIGEYKSSTRKAFKLNDKTAGFELDQIGLFEATSHAVKRYEALSRYPSTERDICFQVDKDTHYSSVLAAAQEVAPQDVTVAVAPRDIYRQDGSPTKNITLNFVLTPRSKTLSSDEANVIVTDIAARVIEKTNATVI